MELVITVIIGTFVFAVGSALAMKLIEWDNEEWEKLESRKEERR